MNVNCIICSDLLGPSDEIYATRCGHAFHHVCLLQWIERSKSCPQCRAKTTDKTIFRIYFNYLNTEGITLDAASLQAKLDNVELQLKLKDRDIAVQRDEIQSLKEKNTKSEDSLLNAKEKLKSKDIAIVGLKEQMDYLKSESKEVGKLRNDKENLENRLVLLKGMEEILYGTISEVEKMVECQTDIRAMCTYITALKRSSVQLHASKKRLSENIRLLQTQLSKANTENSDYRTKIACLEDSLAHCEDEIKQLNSKVRDLETQAQSSSSTSRWEALDKDSPSDSRKRKFTSIEKTESRGSPKARKSLVTDNNEELGVKVLDYHNFNFDSKLKKTKAKSTMDSQSPHLYSKWCNLRTGSQVKATNAVKMSQFSIFKTQKLNEGKKSIMHMQQKSRTLETSYDGFGGHSKQDIFPVAKKHVPSPRKKNIITKEKMKKLMRPANQSTLSCDIILKMKMHNED